MATQLETNLNAILNEKNAKITPENIKKDVTILGVTGTLEEGIDTSDATATASDILEGKTAYVNGEKINGKLNISVNKMNVGDHISFQANTAEDLYDLLNILDTSNIILAGSMFRNCANLKRIPLLDTSNMTNMSYMFAGCNNLESLPLFNTSSATTINYAWQSNTNIKEVPAFNFQNVTSAVGAFYGCTNLITVPVFNFSKATGLGNLFTSCTSLSNESLNNIMLSLISATAYTGTKTLKYIGLSQAQATTCTGLSNYQAFLDAGWTTGY